jgi:hypothetical protein
VRCRGEHLGLDDRGLRHITKIHEGAWHGMLRDEIT